MNNFIRLNQTESKICFFDVVCLYKKNYFGRIISYRSDVLCTKGCDTLCKFGSEMSS